MKDEIMARIPSKPRKYFHKKLFHLNYLTLAILMIGFFLLLYWAGVSILQFFNSSQTQLTINLTQFKSLDTRNTTDCRKNPIFAYPFSVDINDALSNYYPQNYNITSKEPIDLNITLPSGKIDATEYLSQTQSNTTNFFKATQSYSGKAGKVEIEIINAPQVELQEYICSPQIFFHPSATMAYWYGYNYGENTLNAVATRHWLNSGDIIKIVLSGDINLENYSSQGVQKIEILIEGNADRSLFFLQASSPGLIADLPALSNLSFHSDPRIVSWKKINIYGDELKIEQPKGILKLGNDLPIDIDNGVNNPIGKLILPSPFSITGNVTNGSYQVSTTTASVTLNNEELVKSPWQKLTGEAQVGVIGLILTAIGGVGGLWQLYDSKRTKGFRHQSGDFVCVTKTGMTIAGELLRQPGWNFPYYLIKNARRKPSSSEWEKDIISEIKIRADAVEQSYIA